MTKKESKEELEKHIITSISSTENKHININVAKRVIDDVYDDFENRTCSNCKYFAQGTNYRFSTCKLKIFDDYLADKMPFDFGCNKWEKK